VPGNCPDRQTDRHVNLIYKMEEIFVVKDILLDDYEDELGQARYFVDDYQNLWNSF
jgi:hypothetical protein